MSEYDVPCTICEAPAGTPCDCEYGETIAQYRTVVARLKAENEALKKEVASDKFRRIADYEPIFAALRLDYDRAILCIREMQRLALVRNLAGDALAEAVAWRRRLEDELLMGPGPVSPMDMDEAERDEGAALARWTDRR